MLQSIRFITCFIILFSFICEGIAKVDKIKFSKYIVYEGEIEDKMPYRRGVLMCLDPNNKDTYLMRLEGKFTGNLITNAKLSTTDCNGFSFEGTIEYEINTEDKDNPCLTLVLGKKRLSTLTHDKIEIGSVRLHSLLVRELPVSFIYNKGTKAWGMKFGTDKGPSATTIAVLEQMEFPNHIKKFGYNDSGLKGVKCTINVTREGITSADKACTYIFDDSSTYCYPELTFASGGEFFANEKNWYGTHILKNGTSLTKMEYSDECLIKYNSGKYRSYQGTLNCNNFELAEFFGRNATTIDSTLYYNGITTDINGQTEKWFYGESFSVRHNRWLGIYAADLVDSLENELMTENECIASMKRREKIKIMQDSIAALAADSLEMAKTKKILLTYWNITSLAYLEGSITNWNISNALDKTGLEPKYLTGKLSLSLKTNKEALFSITVGPSTEAHKEGLQILSICSNELSKEFKGLWSIEDNKVLINKEDVGLTINSDGSVSYSGLYGGTMRIPSSTKPTKATAKMNQKTKTKKNNLYFTK